jgi:hypothetical protein
MHFRFWFGHTLIGSTHLPLRFRGGSAFLDLQQATLEADGDGFGAVGSVEFGEDRFDVGLGGVFGNGGPRPLPDFIAGNLFLLAQEALANALKHSGARHVTLCVVFSADAVELSVRDDGRGFEPGSAVGVKQGHFGLQGMRERIKRLGGRFESRAHRTQGRRDAGSCSGPGAASGEFVIGKH